MTITNHRACGFCTEFTAKETLQSSEGIGQCKQANPGAAGTTVQAIERPCVLFKRAADLAPREKFVAKHQQREAA